MIKAFIGLPGAGKGYYSVLQAEQELKATDRPIITNFAYELMPWVRHLDRKRKRNEQGFLNYLLAKHGETFDAGDRIHRLTDEEFREFYLWRVNQEGQLFKVEAERDAQGRVVAFDKTQYAESVPCVYNMDESWKFLWSRAWQDTSKGVLYYAAQHRHTGDDVWLQAQTQDQIEKAVRGLVQEWHTLVNHRYRKLGVFRQPDCLSVVVSNENPKDRNKTVGALPKLIKFDQPGVGGSFNTAAGIGVAGMAGDIERKTKGLPWWGVIVAMIGIGVVIISVAKGMGWFSGRLLTGTLGKTGPGKTMQAGAAELQKPWNPFNLPLPSSNPVTNRSVEPAPPVLQMTGYAYVGGGRYMVALSDGRVVESHDGHLQWLDRDSALVDGKQVRLKRLVPGMAAPVVAQPTPVQPVPAQPITSPGRVEPDNAPASSVYVFGQREPKPLPPLPQLNNWRR